MIDREALLDDLKKLVAKLEKDLRERCEENAEVDARVRIEYEKAKEAKRTAQAYKVWRDEWITQIAVAWVLGVVFVRFIEDNGLIAAPFIAGPAERLLFAKEQRTAFFQQNPTLSDREYLEHVFHQVAKLPAMKELYDERHNPLWALGVSGDGAKLILEQFQKIDPASGTLVHDFADPEWNTRFLGDLYQDLSEAARKKYALLQTPEFVEEFILDRTLDPAIAEFGLETVRMIDPTCGSGHFLLGGFARLFRLWEKREPATNRTVLAQRALDAIYGVDINPYATAISRFRLLVAACRASGVRRLEDLPAFTDNLAVGDSLLHGSPGSGEAVQGGWSFHPFSHFLESESDDRLVNVLRASSFHVVVGNPPYPTVSDAGLNSLYRDRYSACSGRYSLVVPFVQRFFGLATTSGHVGVLAASSFSKRSFGRKLVMRVLPAFDLTHVIDTSRLELPGHNTPTYVMFARNRRPVGSVVRVVRPVQSRRGSNEVAPVWHGLVLGTDDLAQGELATSADYDRSVFANHPWKLGSDDDTILARIDAQPTTLSEFVAKIGLMGMTHGDEVFSAPAGTFARRRIPNRYVYPFVRGEEIRNYQSATDEEVLYPYSAGELLRLTDEPAVARFLWPFRTSLGNRAAFEGGTYFTAGKPWWSWHQHSPDRIQASSLGAFAFKATHNEFVTETGGRLYRQTAPVMIPNATTTAEVFNRLIVLLNCSIANYWARRTFQPTGGTGEAWRERFERDASKLIAFPIPTLEKWLVADEIAVVRRKMRLCRPSEAIGRTTSRTELTEIRREYEELFARLVALQESADWDAYRFYGVLDEADVAHHPAGIEPGGRPFEILLAKAVDAGEATSWFDVNGLLMTRDLPESFDAHHRAVFTKAFQSIAANDDIAALERPEYKKRWSMRSWESDIVVAATARLLGIIEAYRNEAVISSTARIAAELERDPLFSSLGELISGVRDFDTSRLCQEIILPTAVPMLPRDRYTETGLRKRSAWEETWSWQRSRDADGTNPADDRESPLPPEYKSDDFGSVQSWRLRGKLDVPKERFISFPGCERESDPSLPILWAGLNHLQQARALAAYYQELKENEAAAPAKLGKLLAGILELIPWLKQWHNDVDPEYGTRMGDFFESFMHAEMAGLGLTMDDLQAIRGL